MLPVAWALLVFAAAFQTPQKPGEAKVNPRIYEDEETAPKPKEYALNPLQARKEVEVGNYYMRKGSFTAAIKRFEEATRWNPKWSVPWMRIGEAYERQENPEDALDAYKKFLELAPKDSKAGEVRKRIQKLQATIKAG